MNSVSVCSRTFRAASSGEPRSLTLANLVELGDEMDTNRFSSADAGLRKNTSLPLPFTSIQSSGRNSLYPSMVSLKGR
jgi:hypothetical protein